MHISKIQLRDWKGYETADFEFPEPTHDQNIVLIGARNGFGKTSLYQAIILCMFGQDGMLLINNSVFFSDENVRDRTNRLYREFLEKALHRGAIAQGRRSCCVKLVFVDDGEPIEISRIWHFNDSGGYQPHDEDIRIFKGKSRTPDGPPTELPQDERKEWYQDYIDRNFLPHSLATFFVFDGEQVRVLAEKNMKEQVRVGIEGLLGIPELSLLSKNLTDYANQRSSNVANVKNENVKIAQDTLATMEKQRDKNIEKYADINPKLSTAQDERNQIQDEMVRLGGGAQTESKQQYKQLAECESTIKECNVRLQKILSEDVAIALSGAGLRKKLKKRLESENIRANWESGKDQGDSRIDNFLEAIDEQMDAIDPPISVAQQAKVIEIARVAWSELWFPPPSNCAKEYLHSYFSVPERGIVIEKLNEQNSFGAATVIDLLDDILKNESKRDRIREEISRFETIEPTLNEKRKRLKELDSKIGNLSKEKSELDNERAGLDGKVKDKIAELARMYKKIEDAKPAIRRAERARKVASMVNEIIKQSVPKQMDKISGEMTKAYRAMAHKKDLLHEIKIVDGNVELLNQQGTDVRDNDLSAGEEQIFTQSLFSAVSSVSKRAFPVVVDTPLGRLDDEHRKGVLRHLAERGEQVILLSTNTEVVGSFLREIESHIQRKYLIQYSVDDGVGRSSVTQGYFHDSETVE